MKRILIFFIGTFLIIGCSTKKETVQISNNSELKIYASSIFLNSDFYSDVIPVFEEIFNCHIELKEFKNAQLMFQQIIAEKDSSEVDIILGLDNTLSAEAISESLFIDYEPKNLKFVQKELIFDETNHLNPVYYCNLAFIFNSNSIEEPPETFGEMQDGKFKKMIVILDPETSSFGRAMLLWSVSAFGENGYGHFWKSVKENIFIVAEDYDDAYNIFLAAEAPLLLGSSTIPVYHSQINKTKKYRSTIPQEGGYNLIHGVGIMRSVKNQRLAEQFVEFLLSEDFQNLIPKETWMFPVNKKVDLPYEFKLLPKPKKDLTGELSSRVVQRRLKSWIKRWKNIMSG